MQQEQNSSILTKNSTAMTQAPANKRHFATAKALWKLFDGAMCHFVTSCGQLCHLSALMPNKTALEVQVQTFIIHYPTEHPFAETRPHLTL